MITFAAFILPPKQLSDFTLLECLQSLDNGNYFPKQFIIDKAYFVLKPLSSQGSRGQLCNTALLSTDKGLMLTSSSSYWTEPGHCFNDCFKLCSTLVTLWQHTDNQIIRIRRQCSAISHLALQTEEKKQPSNACNSYHNHYVFGKNFA